MVRTLTAKTQIPDRRHAVAALIDAARLVGRVITLPVCSGIHLRGSTKKLSTKRARTTRINFQSVNTKNREEEKNT